MRKILAIISLIFMCYCLSGQTHVRLNTSKIEPRYFPVADTSLPVTYLYLILDYKTYMIMRKMISHNVISNGDQTSTILEFLDRNVSVLPVGPVADSAIRKNIR